jgi:hypothetical protein
VIEDPFEKGHNVAFNTFAMYRVRAAFQYAAAVLEAAAQAGDEKPLSRLLNIWDAAQSVRPSVRFRSRSSRSSSDRNRTAHFTFAEADQVSG